MTTVAFKAGVMACDSCASYGDSVDTLLVKIQRLRNGALIGQAGDNDARDICALLNKTKSNRLPPRRALLEIRQGFLGLLVLPTGRIYKVATTHIHPNNWTADMDDEVGLWEISFPFTAIGTGSDLAIGAMEAGADAIQAVEIACRRDMNSRPPVHHVLLNP